jgi:hypothetical protein
MYHLGSLTLVLSPCTLLIRGVQLFFFCVKGHHKRYCVLVRGSNKWQWPKVRTFQPVARGQRPAHDTVLSCQRGHLKLKKTSFKPFLVRTEIELGSNFENLWAHFTFLWPCIVTNFFVIKPNRCTNFPNLLCYETLHVSGSSSVLHQEFIHCTLGTGTCHTGL